MAFEACAVDGCHQPVYSRGWCSRHYSRNRNHRSPTGGKAAQGDELRFLAEALTANEDECVFWPFGKNDKGYGIVLFEGSIQGAHRAACALKHGPAPTKSHEAAHSCARGHEGCVNPHHVHWATHAENCREAAVHRRRKMGRRHPPKKLTDLQVRAIVASEPTALCIDLAAEYGVSVSLISRIRRGERRDLAAA